MRAHDSAQKDSFMPDNARLQRRKTLRAQLVPKVSEPFKSHYLRALSLLASLCVNAKCTIAPSKGVRLTEPPILLYFQTGYNAEWFQQRWKYSKAYALSHNESYEQALISNYQTVKLFKIR
jgi:hypothetical protein